MKKIKPYLPIIYKLLIDLVLLGWEVISKVILPNRKRKGNILSSLFLLFIGLADHLITFWQTMKKTPWTAAPWLTNGWCYGKKYIRQGMIIATWALFILSSFEWSGLVRSLPAQNQQETAENIQPSVRKAAMAYAVPDRFRRRTASIKKGGIICLSPLPFPQPTAKTWLRLCVLRI